VTGRALAGERFAAFAELFDLWTFRDVGAGGASVPQGLTERVGGPAQRLATGFSTLLAKRGADLNYGRTRPATPNSPTFTQTRISDHVTGGHGAGAATITTPATNCSPPARRPPTRSRPTSRT